MHTHSVEKWQHNHVFLGRSHRRHERNVWLVVGLTAVMMVAEIHGSAISRIFIGSGISAGLCSSISEPSFIVSL